MNPEPNPTLAASPDASPEDLFRLATVHPDLILSNPALPLVALERPDLYQKIIAAIYATTTQREIMPRVLLLEEAARRAFSLACAARVVAYHDRTFPERALLPALERASAEPSTLPALHQSARDAAQAAAQAMNAAIDAKAPRTEILPPMVAWYAAQAVVHAAQSVCAPRDTWERAIDAQRFEIGRAFVLETGPRNLGRLQTEMMSAASSLYQWASAYLR